LGFAVGATCDVVGGIVEVLFVRHGKAVPVLDRNETLEHVESLQHIPDFPVLSNSGNTSPIVLMTRSIAVLVAMAAPTKSN
jgi:hypothetical protein